MKSSCGPVHFPGLDDLTFTPIPEPAGLAALGFVAAGLLMRKGRGQKWRAPITKSE